MIITISRQAATNGGLIAQFVAKQLHLRKYNREIVNEIARRLDLDPTHVTPFDEKLPAPMEALQREWRHSINHEIYLDHLHNVLQTIAAQGNAVIVGRGANFILKDVASLRVRVIAPFEHRVAMYQACSGVSEKVAGNWFLKEDKWREAFGGVSEKAARAWITEEDKRRAAFTRQLFHHNIDNPQHYDLCINLEKLTMVQAAALIVDAVGSGHAHNVEHE